MADDLPSEEVNQYRVLRLLDENPSINQRAIARHLNVSLGAVNYILRGLIERGLVKAQNFRNSKNKIAYIYLLTPTGFAQKGKVAARFLANRLREYDLIRREIEAAQRDLEAQASAARSQVNEEKGAGS